MQDLPYPVAPGSFRFGTGYGSKLTPKNKEAFNLVCIRSGVKAPLLSDLSHRARIRYGLDVVDQKQTDEPKYIQYADYVPPPTAELITCRKSRDALFLGQPSRAPVNFNKLQSYSWTSFENRPKAINFAPDLMYRNTFGENNQSGSNLLSPRPEVKGVTAETSRTSSPRSPRRVTNGHVTLPPASPRRKTKPGKENARPHTEGSTRVPTRALTRASDVSKKTEAGALQPNIKPLSAGAEVDQRKKLDGASGCLFSKVQQSIKFVRKVERGEALDVPRLVRPLVTEGGRYRPHSKTRVCTPRLLTPTTHDARNHKSADAYLRIISTPKTAPNLSTATVDANAAEMRPNRSYTSMGSPAMTEILNQYMNGQERFNTPTSILQRASDAQRPFSGTSTRQSVRFENIPAWAKDNGEDTDVDIAPPNPAPTPSRLAAEKAVLPSVHIVTMSNADDDKSQKEE